MKDGVADETKTASSATNGEKPRCALPVGGRVEEEAKPKNGDKSFACRVCNRSFGYKHVLQNHERTHTGEKPFECPECQKRFTRDHHLKTHMRLHTGEKPYQCSHCDRHFVQVANLRRHLRVHTGERPYACQMCESRFSDSNQLKAHILIHRGEKPFECGECLARFRRRHHLLHHKCPKARRTPADHRPKDDEENIEDSEPEPPARTVRILTPQQRELFLRDKVSMQTQAIDMSLSSDSSTVINRLLSVDGVLDLSGSRSDSESEDKDCAWHLKNPFYRRPLSQRIANRLAKEALSGGDGEHLRNDEAISLTKKTPIATV